MTFLDRAYAATLKGADWLAAHRTPALVVALPLTVAALAAINRVVLLGFANSGDESAYLYHASTLTAGRLWNAAPPSADAFKLSYIVFDGDRAFSSFPLGWPLAIAGAMAAGVPAWLLNPILGAATILLTARLGTLLHGARVGALAAVIVGVSPFFLFNGGSYFSHTFCGALLLGAACLASRADRTPLWVPVGVGLLLGLAILARYLTGVVCAIPILFWLIRPDQRRGSAWRQLALVGVGGLPWVLVLAWYNAAMNGNPWQLTTLPLTRGLWFKPGWYYRGADIISTHLQRYAAWTPPLLAALYVYYLRVAPRETRRGWLDWMPVIMIAALYGYVERGGNQYGPRFHYEVYPFLVIFVAGQVFRLASLVEAPRAHRWAFGWLAASVVAVPLLFVRAAVVERHVIEERMDPYTSVRHSGLERAVVFMGGRVGTSRSMAVEDLTRNGIDFSGSVLYALGRSPEQDCGVAASVGRTAYSYEWDWERATSQLTRMACAKESGTARGVSASGGRGGDDVPPPKR